MGEMMSYKKKDTIIAELNAKISELEGEIAREELVNVRNLEDKIARLEQEIHEREYEKREFLCIIEDVDNFLTTNLIPKLFLNLQESERYAFSRKISGYDELAEQTFFIKTWVIDCKQTLPYHEREGYTKIEEYPKKGTYKFKRSTREWRNGD
jgi:hypothetical protein